MRVEVFCPICAAAGIRRKLMEVDSEAKGVVWPWCKGCRRNVKVVLIGNGSIKYPGGDK